MSLYCPQLIARNRSNVLTPLRTSHLKHCVVFSKVRPKLLFFFIVSLKLWHWRRYTLCIVLTFSSDFPPVVSEPPQFIKEPEKHITAEMEKVVDIPCQAKGERCSVWMSLSELMRLTLSWSTCLTARKCALTKLLLLIVCRSPPAWNRVVQGRLAHRPREDAEVQGPGGGEPAGQRPAARRHRHVSVFRPKSGRRSSDQHIPGRYQ